MVALGADRTPGLIIIAVFFFWPAAQALLQSVAAVGRLRHVGRMGRLENFRNLWNDETYLASFYTTAFSPAGCSPGH
jgi:sn-glycerol 3-phosphate transport system permease protein